MRDATCYFAQTRKLGKTPFENLLDRMEEENLITPVGMGGLFFELTAWGVVYTEQVGIVSDELASTNKKARVQMLMELAKTHEEKGSAKTSVTTYHQRLPISTYSHSNM